MKFAVSKMVVDSYLARVRIYCRYGEYSDLYYGQFMESLLLEVWRADIRAKRVAV